MEKAPLIYIWQLLHYGDVTPFVSVKMPGSMTKRSEHKSENALFTDALPYKYATAFVSYMSIYRDIHVAIHTTYIFGSKGGMLTWEAASNETMNRMQM